MHTNRSRWCGSAASGSPMRKLLDAEGNAFEFRISDDHRVNQRRYESLGEGITQHVYGLLEGECRLQRYFIPVRRSSHAYTWLKGAD